MQIFIVAINYHFFLLNADVEKKKRKEKKKREIDREKQSLMCRCLSS
jgi:hypothetical protein